MKDRAGEFKLITGPSGCGKSTLLKIIASLLSPTSGRLFFDDADVATLSPERYRQQVSYCAQTPALFGDSVYDNLIFPWQIRNKQPDPQALLADLQRFGLDENMLEKSINELSEVAVLWVTHDRNEISHADEVITLQPAGGNMQEVQHERA
ncbi:hypothetical protein BXT92_20435 [Klebsiella pneumoniae]|nr:hypothetical protein BXT92_20435 [Klebsiella pneumoniae]